LLRGRYGLGPGFIIRHRTLRKFDAATSEVRVAALSYSSRFRHIAGSSTLPRRHLERASDDLSEDRDGLGLTPPRQTRLGVSDMLRRKPEPSHSCAAAHGRNRAGPSRHPRLPSRSRTGNRRTETAQNHECRRMREVRHAASGRQPGAGAVCRSNRPFTCVRTRFCLAAGANELKGCGRPERASHAAAFH
jgi:hypothetical protein